LYVPPKTVWSILETIGSKEPLYPLYKARSSGRALAGKGTVYKVKRLYEEGKLDPFLKGYEAATTPGATIDQHMEELVNVLKRWQKELCVPFNARSIFRDLPPDCVVVPSPSVSKAEGAKFVLQSVELITNETDSGGLQIVYPFENDRLFRLALEPRSGEPRHLTPKVLWEEFRALEEDVSSLLKGGSDLLGRIREEAHIKTGLSLVQQPEWGIWDDFAMTILVHAWSVLGGHGGMSHRYHRREYGEKKELWLWYGMFALASGSAIGPKGRQPEWIQQAESVHREMLAEYVNSHDVRALRWRLHKADERVEKIRELLEMLAMKRDFPGRCPVCPQA